MGLVVAGGAAARGGAGRLLASLGAWRDAGESRPHPLVPVGSGATPTWALGPLGGANAGLNADPPRLWDSGPLTSPHLPQFTFGHRVVSPRGLPCLRLSGLESAWLFTPRGPRPPPPPLPTSCPAWNSLRGGGCVNTSAAGAPLVCLGAGDREGMPAPPQRQADGGDSGCGQRGLRDEVGCAAAAPGG